MKNWNKIMFILHLDTLLITLDILWPCTAINPNQQMKRIHLQNILIYDKISENSNSKH